MAYDIYKRFVIRIQESDFWLQADNLFRAPHFGEFKDATVFQSFSAARVAMSYVQEYYPQYKLELILRDLAHAECS